MKNVTKEQLAGLASLVGATREQEITCSECAALAAEFAERQVAGRPLDATQAKVEEHLAVCPECREEMRMLRRILESGNQGADSR